jgi:glucans biosynthesis protein
MRILVSLVLLFTSLLPSAPMAIAAVERAVVDHAYVRGLAEERSRQNHRADQGRIPAFFRDLDYDGYRRIRFIPEHALWRADNVPYRVNFFHAGYLFRRSVRIHEFTGTHVQPVPFSTKAFDYQDLNVPFFSRWGLGYAGSNRRILGVGGSDAKRQPPCSASQRSASMAAWQPMPAAVMA